MHRTVKPHPHHLRNTACAIPRASLRSVLLIRAFNAARMCRVSTQTTGKPASASPLKSHCDRLEARSPPHFLHDSASVIQHADARLLDRYVQSSKMVHAALLLLILRP
jgi:hypothetical protein